MLYPYLNWGKRSGVLPGLRLCSWWVDLEHCACRILWVWSFLRNLIFYLNQHGGFYLLNHLRARSMHFMTIVYVQQGKTEFLCWPTWSLAFSLIELRHAEKNLISTNTTLLLFSPAPAPNSPRFVFQCVFSIWYPLFQNLF